MTFVAVGWSNDFVRWGCRVDLRGEHKCSSRGGNVATLSNTLHEDGALADTGRWRRRALGRSEDAEVDEPGT